MQIRQMVAASVVAFALASPASAAVFGGIEFPQGGLSFADTVYSYSPGLNVDAPYNDQSRALGVPDGNHTSLGDQGSIILRFTDNSLTASGDASADLHVFEVGSAVEAMQIAISTDASTWIELGTLSGQPTSIDIDPFAGVTFGTLYSYVRITDAPGGPTGIPYAGADIDAVGAISSGRPVEVVPLPAAAWLLAGALGGLGLLRRRR